MGLWNVTPVTLGQPINIPLIPLPPDTSLTALAISLEESIIKRSFLFELIYAGDNRRYKFRFSMYLFLLTTNTK